MLVNTVLWRVNAPLISRTLWRVGQTFDFDACCVSRDSRRCSGRYPKLAICSNTRFSNPVAITRVLGPGFDFSATKGKTTVECSDT